MKHSIYYISVFLTLTYLSCSVFTKTNTESLLFSLETTPCYGTCPVYKLDVYSTGKAVLNGKEHIEYKGMHSGYIKNEKLIEIANKFEEISFFELNNSYTSDFTDLPTKYITYYKNEKSKTVMAYDNIPKELLSLIRNIEAIVFETKWEQN